MHHSAGPSLSPGDWRTQASGQEVLGLSLGRVSEAWQRLPWSHQIKSPAGPEAQEPGQALPADEASVGFAPQPPRVGQRWKATRQDFPCAGGWSGTIQPSPPPPEPGHTWTRLAEPWPWHPQAQQAASVPTGYAQPSPLLQVGRPSPGMAACSFRPGVLSQLLVSCVLLKPQAPAVWCLPVILGPGGRPPAPPMPHTRLPQPQWVALFLIALGFPLLGSLSLWLGTPLPRPYLSPHPTSRVPLRAWGTDLGGPAQSLSPSPIRPGCWGDPHPPLSFFKCV